MDYGWILHQYCCEHRKAHGSVEEQKGEDSLVKNQYWKNAGEGWVLYWYRRHLLGLCSSWLWRHLANLDSDVCHLLTLRVVAVCVRWLDLFCTKDQNSLWKTGNWKNSERNEHKQTYDFWTAVHVEARCSQVVIPKPPLLDPATGSDCCCPNKMFGAGSA